jgi:putative SOS response-associated peptidase YedK
MAGLWKTVVDEESGEVTTTPNEVMNRVGHHRMPVILEKLEYEVWLKEPDSKKVCELLNEYPAERMNAYPVTTSMNKANFNTKEALEPIGERVL